MAEKHVMGFAHRGARRYAPENTLMAFDLAFDLGADAIECDVQRSRDGALVIIHDGSVNRTTNGWGLVSAMDLDQLRRLNAGARWNMDQRIPTLDETLDLVRRRGGAINLEIKAESQAEALTTAEAVLPVLAALDDDFRSRVLVSSFELSAVALIKRRMPGIRVAALYSGREWRRKDMIAPALEIGAEAIHPGVSLVSEALVTRAHAAGLRVNVWTANRVAVIAGLLSCGVDGIFSDYPERVIIGHTLVQAKMLPESEWFGARHGRQ